MKGLEKSGDQAEGEGEHASDAIAAQVTIWLIKSQYFYFVSKMHLNQTLKLFIAKLLFDFALDSAFG